MPPFETHIVRTVNVSRYEELEAIAENVTSIYEQVAKAGGHVVAQCVIDGPALPPIGRQKEPEVYSQAILITAELPDQPVEAAPKIGGLVCRD
jgi:hypothetical protein